MEIKTREKKTINSWNLWFVINPSVYSISRDNRRIQKHRECERKGEREKKVYEIDLDDENGSSVYNAT